MDLSNNQLSGQALKFQSMVVVRTDVLLDLGRDTAHAHLHSPVLHIVIEIVGGIFYLKKKRLSSNEQNIVQLTANPIEALMRLGLKNFNWELDDDYQ